MHVNRSMGFFESDMHCRTVLLLTSRFYAAFATLFLYVVSYQFTQTLSVLFLLIVQAIFPQPECSDRHVKRCASSSPFSWHIVWMEPCFSSGSTVVMVTNDSDGTSDVFTVSFHVHKSTFNIECNSHSATMSSIHTLLLFEIYRWWFQRFFIFTPTWGRFPFWLLTNIFQMGWNHQLVYIYIYLYVYVHPWFCCIKPPKNMLFVWLDPLSILMLDLEGKLLAQALKFAFGSWRLGHLGTNNGETKSRFSKSEILGLFD